MAFWNESRRGSRLSLDDMARSGDKTLNVLILVLILAAAAFSVFSYGKMSPNVDRVTPPPLASTPATPATPSP